MSFRDCRGLAALFVALTVGCQTAGQDLNKTRDAASVADTAHDVDPEDADTSEDAPDEPDDPSIAFDVSAWQEPNPCQGEVSYPPDDEPFSIPDRGPMEDPSVQTSDEFIENLEEAFPNLPTDEATAIFPDESLSAGPGITYDVYAEPGQDVIFRVYVRKDRRPTVLANLRINLTVMVDYQPVEARYVRWNPDRTEPLSQKTTTGRGQSVQSKVEIIDVTIPSAAFEQQRMYEISVGLEVTSTDFAVIGISKRFALYYGGYDRPSRPCAEPRLGALPTETEEEAYPFRYGDGIATLFFEGMSSLDQLHQSHVIEPGETKTMLLSVWRRTVGHGPRDTVLVPTLNGRPLEDAWWITEGGGEGEQLTRIDARKSFEVTFPEEPGVYEVQVMSWTDPYEVWRERDGTRNEGISDGGHIDEGSNAVRFIVEAN